MKRILGWLFLGLLLEFFGGSFIYLCFLKFNVFGLAFGIGLFTGGICCIAILGTGRPILSPPLDVPFSLLFQRKMRDGIELVLVGKNSVRFFQVNPEKIILYNKDNEATGYDNGEWPAEFCFFRPKKSLNEKLHVIPKGSDLYTVIYSKE
jgi:hypothetical protein